MPRVTRGYERQDFSALLNELNMPEEKEKPLQSVSIKRQEISDYQRKRASLLGNSKMRYAYSDVIGVLHDRDCELVKDIKDKHFKMSADLNPEMELCSRCYRKALIRSGIGDDSKRINAYVNFFNRMNASDACLRVLFMEHGAKIYGIDIDHIYLKVHDDRWILRCTDEQIQLFHNSYEIIGDYERLFKNDFHLQRISGEATFPNFVRAMCFYSWKNHVKSFRFAAHLKRCEELRQSFANIANYTRQRKISLLHTYYVFMDLNRYGIRLCKLHGLEYAIISRHSHPNTKYKTVTCKVRLWHRKRFVELMEKLKEYCVEQEASDYGEYCLKLGSVTADIN